MKLNKSHDGVLLVDAKIEGERANKKNDLCMNSFCVHTFQKSLSGKERNVGSGLLSKHSHRTHVLHTHTNTHSQKPKPPPAQGRVLTAGGGGGGGRRCPTAGHRLAFEKTTGSELIRGSPTRLFSDRDGGIVRQVRKGNLFFD